MDVRKILQRWLGRHHSEPKHTWKYKWRINSRSDLKRHMLYGTENEVLQKMRDQDLINPAPFTHQTLISFDGRGAPDFEKPSNFHHNEPKSVEWIEIRADVPVTQIIGLGCTGNLDNYREGMTFREVLFESLHGDGITDESVAFLVGHKSKDLEMPHQFNRNNPKSRSAGGLELSQYGDWFIVHNGHQRSIIAMYAIWQRYGDAGLLRNVTVSKQV